MAKTSNKKKQPAEVETLRETIAKTKVVEQPKKKDNETEKVEKVEKVEKTEKTEKTETVATEAAMETKKKPASKAKEQPSGTTLDVDDLTGALEAHKTRKKPVMTALIALLTVLVVVGLTFWFLYWGANRHESQDEPQVPAGSGQVETEDKDEVKVIEETDYMQDIVGENNIALNPVYYLGTKDNFTLKFKNLNCDETCSNVDDVKIGGKALTAGQDYVVKREDGVTLVIYAATLNKYEAGDSELTFRILQEKDDHKELRTIGVKFEIKKAIVCGENQIVENGQCVDKNTQTTRPEEKPEDSEQAKCEAQAGPDFVYQVHWYTDDERREVVADYGYDDSVIVSVVRGDFVGDKNGMKLINGVCRPNPNATAVTAGAKSYSESNLSSIDSNFAALVMGNAQQDILVYAWRTNNGTINYRMELLK